MEGLHPSCRDFGLHTPSQVPAGVLSPGDARSLLRQLRRRGLGVRPTARGVRLLHPAGVPAALRERRRLGDACASLLREYMIGRAIRRCRALRAVLAALLSLRGSAPAALVAAVAGMDEAYVGRMLLLLESWGIVTTGERRRPETSWREWRVVAEGIPVGTAGRQQAGGRGVL